MGRESALGRELNENWSNLDRVRDGFEVESVQEVLLLLQRYMSVLS